ncbi:biphenyl 2,3-dioxygenase [Photobacterium indicum]|uniref:Biphenyl 2,3-dioxygenase n=1 Tax=Photobacterium indicum TaxID=81447 RepID=A0A2T3L8V3_9GAMM|nr:biphenyl 2,3-dioxygenase [Photobacterium indicum]PSV47427.1 biphenyl 2,3-dioxygenase [Photobacterium indicum]
MQYRLLGVISAVLISLVCTGSVLAAGDMTKQEPIEMKVLLGNDKNAMRFFPDKLEFETGKLYKLILHNEGKEKHYFSSEGLAQAVFTRKTQVVSADGKVIAEIKGTVREIEVYPGGTAEWWFVPVKATEIKGLKCTIKGHAEAGMTGSISIK